jgi:hypothetical protein
MQVADGIESIVLYVEPMANTAERLATLEERVNSHIKFIWAVAGFFVLWLGSLSGFLISINSKIDRIPTALSGQLIEQSRKLITEKKPEDAARSLALATALITAAGTQRTKVTPDYFYETAKQLQQVLETPELRQPAHAALIQLASYKSTLERPPSISGPEKSTDTPVTDPAFWKGVSVVRTLVHGDMIQPPFERKLSTNIAIYGPVVFIGAVPDASQTLDGIHWINVTFVNMRIRYQGGEVDLRSVRFVNCTFDFPNDPKGNQMIATIATRAELSGG